MSEVTNRYIHWALQYVLTGLLTVITGVSIATYNKLNEQHDFVVQQREINKVVERDLSNHATQLSNISNLLNKKNHGTFEQN